MRVRRGSLTEKTVSLTNLKTTGLTKSNSVRSLSFRTQTVEWKSVNMGEKYECVTKLGQGGQASAYLLSNKNLPNKQVVAKVYVDTPQTRKIVTNEILVLKHLNSDGCKPFLLCFQENFTTTNRGLPVKCRTQTLKSDNTVLVVIYDYFFGPGTKDMRWLLNSLDMDEEDYIELSDQDKTYMKYIYTITTRPVYQLTLILTLIKTLAYLHSREVAHLDLKPANVIINIDTGRIQLIDFGVSCMEQECIPNGTPTHMSPEVIKIFGKEKRNVRILFEDKKTRSILPIKEAMTADAWSLGILLFEYIHGEVPYPYTSEINSLLYNIATVKQENMKKFNFVHYNVDVMEAINFVVNGFLRVDPKERITIIEAKQILDPLINAESTNGTTSPLSPKLFFE